MRIRIFSDLHLEFFAFEPVDVPADVVVLAGDIQNGHYGLGWARKTFPDTAIVYVMGNHEFSAPRSGPTSRSKSHCCRGTGRCGMPTGPWPTSASSAIAAKR